MRPSRHPRLSRKSSTNHHGELGWRLSPISSTKDGATKIWSSMGLTIQCVSVVNGKVLQPPHFFLADVDLCCVHFGLMCSLNLLGTPRRGLCVRSHHHGKKVRERSSAFTITVSDLHSHFSFSCCTCQLMLLDSFFTAVVLGVGFNGALFVGASRWYRVSFPSIGPPLTLLLFSVA